EAQRLEPVGKGIWRPGNLARLTGDHGALGLDPLSLQRTHPEVLLQLVAPAPGRELRPVPSDVPPVERAVEPLEEERGLTRLPVVPRAGFEGSETFRHRTTMGTASRQGQGVRACLVTGRPGTFAARISSRPGDDADATVVNALSHRCPIFRTLRG